MTRSCLYWLNALLCSLIAFASWRFFIGGVEATMSAMLHQYLARPWALYGHIVFAPLALLLLPLQLSKTLRQHSIKRHRYLGYLYTGCVLIASTHGFILALNTDAGMIAATGFALLAILWLLTTLMGVYHAINHNLERHHTWILRSCALTFSAVTLRLYLLLAWLLGFDMDHAYLIIAWACWVPNLIFIQLWIGYKPSAQTHTTTQS